MRRQPTTRGRETRTKRRAGGALPRVLTTPVDYSARTAYRRPPLAYRRLQWLAPVVTALGLSPADVVTLEVPGRRTGRSRRTCLVRVRRGGRAYLVALAGESEWVRNVRSAGGRVRLGRRWLRPALLTRVPVEDRAPVLRDYLTRSGSRPPDSPARAREASHYFGVSAAASPAELSAVAEQYPVFRVDPVPG